MSSFSHPCSLAMEVLSISCSLLPLKTSSLTPGDSLSLFSPFRFIQLSILRLEIHSSPDQSNHNNPILSATLPWPCGPDTSHAPSQFADLAENWGFFWFAFVQFGVFFQQNQQAGHRVRCGTSQHGMALWHVTIGSIQSALKPGVLGPLVKEEIPACWMGPTVARTRQKPCSLLLSHSFYKKT